MSFLKTLLAGAALSAALLTWIGLAIGPEGPAARTSPGLTTAAVLASDGMVRDGAPRDPALDREGLGRLARHASEEARDAASVRPAG